MTALEQRIGEDLKRSLRGLQEDRVLTLRLLLAELHNKKIETRKKDVGLGEEEVLEVLRKEVKKRLDAIQEFKKASRDDLVRKEEAELLVLKDYLPPELSREEILRVVRDSVRETNASGPGDFGKVMKSAMTSLKGRVSGDEVASVVKEVLA